MKLKKHLAILLLLVFGITANLFPQTTGQTKQYQSAIDLSHKAKPAQRAEFFNAQRAYPYQVIDREARQNAIRQSELMKFNKKGSAYLLSQQPEWRCIGPFDIGGRVKTIVHHPTISGTVYIGAAAGGIWKTTDGGQTWEPIFDDQNAIAFGALAIDNNNPDIIYAATGEAANNIDSYLGAGIYKSTDAGESWTIMGLTTVGSFCRMFVHPKNSNLIYAGAMKGGQGLWKSTDAGGTWIKKYDASVSDISINPNDENELVIGVNGGGVFLTSDGGETWEQRNEGFRDFIGRVSVQYARSNPNILFALMENTEDGNNIGNIYKSTNKGKLWLTSLKGAIDFFGTNNQGFYDNYLEINPKDPNIVLAGGIYEWKTGDGGENWRKVPSLVGGQGTIHVDQHCASFDPNNPSNVYIGNDGGMFKSTNSGDSWININNNLQITQFYAMDIDPTKPNRNYGGTQDNGTQGNYTNPDEWGWIMGGDGFSVLVGLNQPKMLYGEYPNGEMWRVDFATNSADAIVDGIPTSDEGLWHSPIAISDYDGEDFLYHGRGAIYISYDQGDYWFKMLNASGTGKFTSIEASRANPNIIYAGKNDGELWFSSDIGEKWKNISDGSGLSVRYITDIKASYKNENIAYISFSGYGSPHIFKTTDQGKSWINISNGLPDIPVNAIEIHPDNENWLFIATDIGVYASFDDGGSWFPFGMGLPRSPMIDIKFHPNRAVLPELTLRVASHGRSMWEIEVPADAVISPEITIPAGGEKYISTTSQKIQWYGFTLPVKIEHSTDDGKNWSVVNESVDGTWYYWNIPSSETVTGRIRISAVTKPEEQSVTNTFTIKLKDKGSVLGAGRVTYIPYGIAYDGKGSLWTTTFGDNKVIKLSASTLTIEKTLTVPGDTLTDLDYDAEKGLLYVHRMYNTQGGGGQIYTIDTNGTLINTRNSPSDTYPIGLELVDGMLLVGDRDGKRNLNLMNPSTGQITKTIKNPCQLTYGPRGLAYDGNRYIYQLCTNFPSGGALTDCFIQKIDKNNMGVEVERMRLEDFNGLINGRGITYNPQDKNFWVSDYGGSIYYIAGFETVVGVEDLPDINNMVMSEVYPNPITSYSNISLKNNGTYGKFEIRLTDITGSMVRELFSGYLGTEAEELIHIGNQDLVPGLYNIIILKDGDYIRSHKLINIK
jgi:photosystem II stability/assembly factor-like uncharacterized protein